MCRLLHVIGTGLVIASMLYNIKVIPGFLAAGYLGHVLFPLMRSMDHGLIEGAILLSLFVILAWRATGSLAHAMFIPVCGYAFAWVGHFAFEQNRPATFIYPSWSLFSDFVMFYQTVTGQWSLLPELTAAYAT